MPRLFRHTCPTQPLRPLRGFTLIEVMVVVVIVGLLATIALPGYQAHLQRGRRAEAQAALLQAAQWLERLATATGSYLTEAEEPLFPPTLQKVPSGAYRIGYTGSENGQQYLLTATPSGLQSTDRCGALTLDQTGLQGVSGSLPLQECWGR